MPKGPDPGRHQLPRAGRTGIVTSLTIIILVAALVGSSGAGAATAGAATARAQGKSCGFLWHYFTDVGARGTTCVTARRIASRYMRVATGSHPRFPRHELGFRCRRINTPHAGGGWVAQCRKGRAVVDMTPT
jgi:hypothetical protein